MRHYLLIFLFVVMCFSVSLTSLVTESTSSGEDLGQSYFEKDENKESYFNKLKYFISNNSTPVLKVTTNELIQSNTKGSKKLTFYFPDGVAYSKSKEPIHYKAKNGVYTFSDNLLVLNKNVEVKTTNSNIKSEQVTYNIDKDIISGSGNVRTNTLAQETLDLITINSDTFRSFPNKKQIYFNENVTGVVERKKKYEAPVRFTSSALKLDLPINKINLDGDVHINKKNLKTWAKRGEMFLENYNKRLKYFSLYDDVRVEESLLINGKSVLRKAFGERLEGFTSLDRLVLTGYPKVYQEGDVIKGNKITLRINNEVVEVDDANTRFKLK
ncbi:MAG: LptA/OstA family protein [Bacteriovoracaceae bacterium]